MNLHKNRNMSLIKKNRSIQVVFSDQSYLSMITEVFHHNEMETGGILLGKEVNSIWYVFENIDPGYSSVIHKHAYFEYDVQYVNHLANVRNRLYENDIELLGLWHRHPGSFNQFSKTDDKTNIDFAKLHVRGAISAIINLNKRVELTMYHVSLPLKYKLIDNVLIGNKYIPSQLMKFKNPKTVIGNNSKYNSEYDEKINKVDSVFGLLEFELDNYLEVQSDYSYEISMLEDQTILINMKYTGKIYGYPKIIKCYLSISNNKRYITINNNKYEYKIGILEQYIHKFIDKNYCI